MYFIISGIFFSLLIGFKLAVINRPTAETEDFTYFRDMDLNYFISGPDVDDWVLYVFLSAVLGLTWIIAVTTFIPIYIFYRVFKLFIK